jgi:hypothetical protein
VSLLKSLKGSVGIYDGFDHECGEERANINVDKAETLTSHVFAFEQARIPSAYEQ